VIRFVSVNDCDCFVFVRERDSDNSFAKQKDFNNNNTAHSNKQDAQSSSKPALINQPVKSIDPKDPQTLLSQNKQTEKDIISQPGNEKSSHAGKRTSSDIEPVNQTTVPATNSAKTSSDSNTNLNNQKPNVLDQYQALKEINDKLKQTPSNTNVSSSSQKTDVFDQNQALKVVNDQLQHTDSVPMERNRTQTEDSMPMHKKDGSNANKQHVWRPAPHQSPQQVATNENSTVTSGSTTNGILPASQVQTEPKNVNDNKNINTSNDNDVSNNNTNEQYISEPSERSGNREYNMTLKKPVDHKVEHQNIKMPHANNKLITTTGEISKRFVRFEDSSKNAEEEEEEFGPYNMRKSWDGPKSSDYKVSSWTTILIASVLAIGFLGWVIFTKRRV